MDRREAIIIYLNICKMNFITKTGAISSLGISHAQFSKLNIKPAKTARNPHNKSGKMFLYDSELIEHLRQSEIIRKIHETKSKKTPKNYEEIFRKRKYEKEEAISLAAEYMFNLNRYAKNQKCSSDNRCEIYEIKNKLVEFLYKHNYCADVKVHQQMRTYYDRYFGIEEYPYVYYCFTFMVSGKAYCWHQPEEDIRFKVDLKDSKYESMPEIEHNQEIVLNKCKFKEAKEFVKWVIKNF